MIKRKGALALAAAALALVLGGGAVALNSGQGSSPPPASQMSVTVMSGLPVKGKAALTGYTREQFGDAWFDVDNNRCDTRDDVLAAQLTAVRKSGRCIVIGGTLADPYTGRTITFTRGACKAGQTSGCSGNVQIDHIVSLANAWQTGAQKLTPEQRRQLANDPLNLQATDGPTNAAKGDGDAATWLPPQRGYWCTYVERQVAVKAKYGLWLAPAEHDRIADILRSCP